MDRKGMLNESEMMQRTCKFAMVLRVNDAGQFAGVNRVTRGDTVDTESEQGMSKNWNKCEGSRCAHWRWYLPHWWSKATYGGKGFCGLAGKPR